MVAPPPLPPGVYFNPLPEECVRDYLRPWIESGCDDDAQTPPRHGAVFPVDVYRHSPGELRRLFPPGHARGFERKWYFLTPCGSYGGRGRRRVATGGNWKVEQKTKDLDGDGSGKRRTYGFYLPDGRKTPWLMEELAAADDGEGGGKEGRSSVPVFCRIYVSPRADDDDRRAILGEAGVAVDGEGKAKPATIAIDDEYFDLLAARLPSSCFRVYGGAPPPGDVGHQQAGQVASPPADFIIGHQHDFQPAPLPPPPVFPTLHHAQPPAVYGHQQQGHAAPQDVLDYQHGIHQVGDPHGLAAPPQPPAVHGLQHYYVQDEAPPDFLGHYLHGQNAGFYDAPPPPIHVAPPQDEEETHVEKKPRLTYASPAPQPVLATSSTTPKCKIEVSEFEEQYRDANGDAAVLQELPAPPAPTPEEEIPGTASPPPPVDEALPPQPPPAIEFDACQHAPKDPSPDGGSMDLSNLTHVSFGDDFGMACESSQFLFDGGEPLGFDSFPLQDILQSNDFDYDGSWIDDMIRSEE